MCDLAAGRWGSPSRPTAGASPGARDAPARGRGGDHGAAGPWLAPQQQMPVADATNRQTLQEPAAAWCGPGALHDWQQQQQQQQQQGGTNSLLASPASSKGGTHGCGSWQPAGGASSGHTTWQVTPARQQQHADPDVGWRGGAAAAAAAAEAAPGAAASSRRGDLVTELLRRNTAMLQRLG